MSPNLNRSFKKVRRVQKYVETLDMLKIRNSSTTSSNGVQNSTHHHQKQSNGKVRAEQQPRHSNGHRLSPIEEQQPRHSVGHLPIHQQPPQQEQQSRHSTSGVVVTTKWETFDSMPALVPHPSTSSSISATHNPVQPKFNWEFFE